MHYDYDYNYDNDKKQDTKSVLNYFFESRFLLSL
jgi:hypothetical protein